MQMSPLYVLNCGSCLIRFHCDVGEFVVWGDAVVTQLAFYYTCINLTITIIIKYLVSHAGLSGFNKLKLINKLLVSPHLHHLHCSKCNCLFYNIYIFLNHMKTQFNTFFIVEFFYSP